MQPNSFLICLRCRSRQAPNSSCRRVVDIATTGGRDRFWDSIHKIEVGVRAEHAARWLARIAGKLTFYGAAPVAGLALGIATRTNVLSSTLLVTAAALPISNMAHLSLSDDESAFPRWDVEVEERHPLGARPCAAKKSADLFTGVAEGEATLEIPGGMGTCLAYQLELIHEDAKPSPVLVRDGYCSGLAVENPDGDHCEVGSGAIDLSGGHEYTLSRRKALAHFAQLGEIEFDQARLRIVRPGDPIQVQATLRESMLHEGPYRTRRQRRYMATGIAQLSLRS